MATTQLTRKLSERENSFPGLTKQPTSLEDISVQFYMHALSKRFSSKYNLEEMYVGANNLLVSVLLFFFAFTTSGVVVNFYS